MTFGEVIQDLMTGNPVSRTAWENEDEARIVYYDTQAKAFVDRRTSGEWQSKYLCVIGEDMNANDWELCEWEEGDKECSTTKH
jgi:hypothetical protein